MKPGQQSLVAAVVAILVIAVAGQSLTPRQCNDQKNNLKNTCRSVQLIFGRKPSAACCQLVREANVECVCPFVTPKLIAALGGVNRVVGLIRNCGRTVPRNFKCGSK